jgi:hypothetical protein
VAVDLARTRQWQRPRIVVELLLAVGAVIAAAVLVFADLGERQSAFVSLYIWVLVARNAVIGFLRSRRSPRNDRSGLLQESAD